MRIYTSTNRVGQKFGTLTVVAPVPNTSGLKENKKWLCKCECGNEKIIRVDHLIDGSTQSCGCKKKEKLRDANIGHGFSKDMTCKSEYYAWTSMKMRCYNPKCKQYKNYGARGIIVSERWLGENGFPNFISDMGKKPTAKHSIDRINNNGNYEVSNCKWSTMPEQNRNKRDNNVIEYEGKRMVLLDWANYFGIERSFIYRLLEKHTTDEAFKKIKSGNYRERKIYVTPKRSKA